MTVAPAALQPGVQLGTSATLLYATPSATTAVVKRATFTNTDAVAHALTVYRCAPGVTPGPTNAIISAYPVSAGQDYSPVSLGNLVLAAGEKLWALADTAMVINAFASGFTA